MKIENLVKNIPFAGKVLIFLNLYDSMNRKIKRGGIAMIGSLANWLWRLFKR